MYSTMYVLYNIHVFIISLFYQQSVHLPISFLYIMRLLQYPSKVAYY